jgi:hypothetical protein
MSRECDILFCSLIRYYGNHGFIPELAVKQFGPSIAEEIVAIYLYGSSITERLTEETWI